MNPSVLQRIALASLAALIVVSGAIAWWPTTGIGAGAVLALFKIAVLALIFVRVRRTDLYSMQLSSMLILLFVAEGAVRAMTDPPPSSALGMLEFVAAVAFFVAVLMILRPFKKAARGTRR